MQHIGNGRYSLHTSRHQTVPICKSQLFAIISKCHVQNSWLGRKPTPIVMERRYVFCPTFHGNVIKTIHYIRDAYANVYSLWNVSNYNRTSRLSGPHNFGGLDSQNEITLLCVRVKPKQNKAKTLNKHMFIYMRFNIRPCMLQHIDNEFCQMLQLLLANQPKYSATCSSVGHICHMSEFS